MPHIVLSTVTCNVDGRSGWWWWETEKISAPFTMFRADMAFGARF
jgi:hypothetical protein